MKIEFHYTYLIVALSFILTGYFSNLIIFTSILLIHEIGHYSIAKLNNFEVDKIVIYPYGGITKLKINLNAKINKELSVAISGIIFQIVYYIIIIILYKNNLIREYIFNLFKTYHHSILIFNLIPVHPLDGSKILNLILSKILPYKTTNKITILISIISILILLKINYYHFNYTTILILSVIIDSIFKYYKELNYLFNRFLLERYLYKQTYKKSKTISKIDNMYKDKYHVIKRKNNYITEKQALSHRFKGKF